MGGVNGMAGRRPVYTDEMGDDVLERITEGQSIREIAGDPALPGIRTIMNWSVGESGAPEDYPERYTRALELRGEAAADKIRQIIKDLEAGKIDANAARVIIDAEKWIASKLHPRIYGDRREHKHIHKVETSVGDRLRRADERQKQVVDGKCNGAPMIDITPTKVAVAGK